MRGITTRLLMPLAVVALLLSGCAGIRPAVKPERTYTPQPVLKPGNVLKPEQSVVPEDTVKVEPNLVSVTPGSTAGSTSTKSQSSPRKEATPHHPTPVDTLSFPMDAAPPPPDTLVKTPIVKTEGDSTLIPPALGEGWKVQVASYTDKETVNGVHVELKQRLTDYPVHLRYLEGRYIILVGNFIQREPADSLRDVLTAEGFPDAFVVQSPVVVHHDSGKVDTTTSLDAPASKEVGTVKGWRIQVMSLSSRTSAEQESRKATVKTGMSAYIVETDGMYKIRLGDFTDESFARLEMARIASVGFAGAFLVTDSVNVAAEGGE